MNELTVVPPVETKPALPDTSDGMSSVERVHWLIEKFRNAPLASLASARRELTEFQTYLDKELDRRGGELDDETEGLLQYLTEHSVYITDLLKGKIDGVAVVVKHKLPAMIDAYKARISSLEDDIDRLKDLTIQSLEMLDTTKIEGDAWRARVQTNPPRLTIENPAGIPEMFCNAVLSIKYNIDPNDKDTLDYWKGIIANHKDVENFTGSLNILPNNDEIKKAVINEGLTLEGVKVERGVHVRFEQLSRTPKKTKPKEIEQ